MCMSEPHVRITFNHIDYEYHVELIVDGEVVVKKRYVFRWIALWRSKALLRRHLKKSELDSAIIIREKDLE